MQLNPEFLKYKREIVFENNRHQCIKITWPPGHWSVPHDHGKSHGYFQVLSGKIFQITYSPKIARKNKSLAITDAINPFSEKIILEEGMMAPETPGIIHVIGNDSINSDAITLHYYSPCLVMKEYPNMSPGFMAIMLSVGKIAELSQLIKSW